MLTWTYDELARLFHRGDGRFDHQHLIDKHGFPRPLPGFRQPLIWSRVQVRAWLAGHSAQVIARGTPDAAAAVEAAIAADRTVLDRLGGRA